MSVANAASNTVSSYTFAASTGLFFSTVVTPQDCATTALGTITVNATGGTAPYTYSIGGAFQTSNFFSGLSANTYTVTVKDSTGITFSKSVTVSSTRSTTNNNLTNFFTAVYCNGCVNK